MRPKATLVAAFAAVAMFTWTACSDDPGVTSDAADTADATSDDTSGDATGDTLQVDSTDDTSVAETSDDTIADDTTSEDTVAVADTNDDDTAVADTVDDDTAIADTVDGDTTGSDADTSGPQVALTFHLVEFLSAIDLEGLELTIGGETATTDSGGMATLDTTAGADFVLKITGDDIRDHYIYARAPGADTTLRYLIAVDSTVAAVGGVFNVDVDPAKAIVDLAPRDEDGGYIAGMTLGIDATSDLQLVPDVSSGVGVSVGDTTLEGSESTTIFVNVPAGSVTPSFSHPWGYVCDVGPDPIDVPAGSYIIAEYRCHYTPNTQVVSLSDFLTSDPIAGASVAVFGQTVTSDDNGTVTFQAPPNADILMVVTGSGFRDHYLYRHTRSTGDTYSYSLATDSAIAALETVLGQQVDDSDGILAVAPRAVETLANLGGVTVALGQSYDLALVFDQASAYGLSPGTTTLEGSQATVIFVNTPPAAVTPTFTSAAGYVCDIGPVPVDVPAGAYVLAEYQCAAP